jgi:hypothetical protein
MSVLDLYVPIINRALQQVGTRTNVTVDELTNQSSNEAIQASTIVFSTKDELLRMAPWDCAFNFAVLSYITSAPGTPENAIGAQATWAKGQPPPPWAYEYQYPADCLRACWVIPQLNTGFSSGVPITSAVTGGTPAFWNGPPVKFKVAIDQFFAVTAAVVVNGGVGHALGDVIVLNPGAYSPTNIPTASPPIGAPAILEVTAVSGGAITSVSVVSTFAQSLSAGLEPVSGSYFAIQPQPIAQGTTSGVGTGATFNVAFNNRMDQRVILTNQQFAILAYVKQVSDPNVMDPLFVDAWIEMLGAKLVMALTGDKALANENLKRANAQIINARNSDANEGLTVNDVTPDWIRARGLINPADFGWSPNIGYDWGGLLTMY